MESGRYLVFVSQTLPAPMRGALERFAEVRYLPPYRRIDPRFSSHADLLLCSLPGRDSEVWTFADYCEDNRPLFDGLTVHTIAPAASPDYPDIVALSALFVTPKLCLARRRSLAAELVSACAADGIAVAYVRQGFAHCSGLAVRGALISSDVTLLKAAKIYGIPALAVSDREIGLPGCDHGFIGGASCAVGDKVLFFGSLKAMADGGRIAAFLSGRGSEAVSLGEDAPFDCGGALVLAAP